MDEEHEHFMELFAPDSWIFCSIKMDRFNKCGRRFSLYKYRMGFTMVRPAIDNCYSSWNSWLQFDFYHTHAHTQSNILVNACDWSDRKLWRIDKTELYLLQWIRAHFNSIHCISFHFVSAVISFQTFIFLFVCVYSLKMCYHMDLLIPSSLSSRTFVVGDNFLQINCITSSIERAFSVAIWTFSMLIYVSLCDVQKNDVALNLTSNVHDAICRLDIMRMIAKFSFESITLLTNGFQESAKNTALKYCDA